MKADLYIGDDQPESVELVADPHPGQLIIFAGKEHRIRDIAHDADKKKLRVVCEAPRSDPEPERLFCKNTDSSGNVVNLQPEIVRFAEGDVSVE